MKKYALVMLLLLYGLAPLYAAKAVWICQVKMAKTSSIPIRYEIRKNKLLGYEDDYTGRPNVYAIRINTTEKLVAVRISRRRTVTITIDKPSRRFLEVTALRKYREALSGICAPFER